MFALNSQVQAEIIIQGLNTPNNEARKVKSQVNPIIQGYFKAVASGDTKAALSYYAWSDISPTHMAGNRQAAVEVMKLLKQQIDTNGGLRNIELIGFFPRLDKAKAILEIEFNKDFNDNNYKRLAELSVHFDIKYGNGKMDYNRRINFLLDNGQWKVLLGDIK